MPVSDHVLGLDLSLSSTGAATLSIDGRVDTWVKTTDPVHDDDALCDRIGDITAWCLGLLTVRTKLVVLEAPSFGSQHGQQHERAGLWWAVRRGLARRGIPVGRVAPKTLKARIAGSGKASKDDMRRAVARLYPGQGLARISFDEADAVGLAVLGVIRLRWDGHPWIGAHAPDSAGVWSGLDDYEAPAPVRVPTADPFRTGANA